MERLEREKVQEGGTGGDDLCALTAGGCCMCAGQLACCCPGAWGGLLHSQSRLDAPVGDVPGMLGVGCGLLA